MLLLYAFFFITFVIYFCSSSFFHFYLNTSFAFFTVINSQKLYWVCCKVSKYSVFYIKFSFFQASLQLGDCLFIINSFLLFFCIMLVVFNCELKSKHCYAKMFFVILILPQWFISNLHFILAKKKINKIYQPCAGVC